MSRDLVELGRAVVEELASECASERRVPRLQLLASPFYEAVKGEIGRTPESQIEKIRALKAAADRCRRAASPVVTPATILMELRAAVAMVSSKPARAVHALPAGKPQLRVIKGGLR